MRTLNAVLLAVVLLPPLAACDSNKKDGEAPASKGGADGKGGKGEKGKDGAKKAARPLAELFDSKKPALPAPFDRINFGMGEAGARAALPDIKDLMYYKPEEFPGVTIGAFSEGEGKTISQVRIGLPKAEALPVLKAAWGEPKEIEHRRKPAHMWWNAEDRIRATLTDGTSEDKLTVVLEPYVPSKEVVGEGKAQLGFEKPLPLLGATVDAVLAAYPAAMKGAQTDTLKFMKFAPNEYGDQFQVELGVTDGKVDRLQFWLHHGKNAAAKDELLGLLKAKYGDPKEVTAEYTGRKSLQFNEAPKVMVNETDGAWVIEVTAK